MGVQQARPHLLRAAGLRADADQYGEGSLISESTGRLNSGAPVRLRAVAIPAEHGGWSFLLEPILLGWLVAPSAAGLLVGVGMIFAFLARHPLKLALSDRRRGKRLARTAAAERFAVTTRQSA
ncbi:MAG: YwiC-like family protein [Anaerolineae bacterium]